MARSLVSFVFTVMVLSWLSLLIPGCQPEMTLSRERCVHDAGVAPWDGVPGDADPRPRIPLIDTRGMVSDVASKELAPSDDQPDMFPTSLALVGGCEYAPVAVMLPKEHREDDVCDMLAPLAIQTIDGEDFEVDAQAFWTVADPRVVELHCPKGIEHADLCHATARQDVFDGDGVHEPWTTVTACVPTTCAATSSSCAQILCASTVVVGVLDLSGPWEFRGYQFEALPFVRITQSGRVLDDDLHRFTHASVEGETIRFVIGDVEYTGTVRPDRRHIVGESREMMGGGLIGNWVADRSGVSE